MSQIGAPLVGSYDLHLVALSFLIGILASYVALDLAARVTAARGRARRVWLMSGAISMGVGIWSMHFVGMLAFGLSLPVRYDLPTVLLSLLAAILASTVALYVASRKRFGRDDALVGSLVMGSGVASMHYLGMAAMRLSAACDYNPLLLGLSIVIAVVASLAALTFAFNFHEEPRHTWAKGTSAVVMGVAIASMHYTGMAAATFRASGIEPDLRHSITVSVLGTTGIILVTLLILGVAMLSSIVDRRFEAQAFQLALARANMGLVHVGRAASLGELAASIAHEINQPLGAVVNSASATLRWLASQPPNLQEAWEAATQTVREANRASEVIARTRALLKKETPRMERLDLNEVIRDAFALAGNDIAKGRVAVKSELSASAPTVSGDRVQLQQVMLNLIINGIEAMDGVRDRQRELRIESKTDSGLVYVSVEDTGVGLGQEDLDRLFHPFYTTKRTGIGMGLSISRSIIEAHGGRLWAEPRSPHGAVFRFSLPKADGAE
jgi:two-component system sensor histidine kinase/response regulator